MEKMTRKTRTFWSVAWVAGAVASLAWKILNFEHGTFWNLTALAGVAIALVMVVLALVTQRREASPVSTASNAPRAPERRLAVSNVSRTCAEKESCPTVSSRRSETGSEFEAGSAVKIGGVVWHAHTARPEPDAAVGRLSSRQNRAMRSPAQSLQRESPCWSALPWRLIPLETSVRVLRRVGSTTKVSTHANSPGIRGRYRASRARPSAGVVGWTESGGLGKWALSSGFGGSAVHGAIHSRGVFAITDPKTVCAAVPKLDPYLFQVGVCFSGPVSALRQSSGATDRS